MGLVSVTYTSAGPSDNRKVTFLATPDVGEPFTYIVRSRDPAWNPETALPLIQAKLEAKLGEREVRTWLIETEAPITTIHATKAQYAAAIRETYKHAEKEELYRLAYKLYSRYQAGDFTAAQLRAAFGMTTPEFNDFATNKLIPAHDAWIAMQSAVGE
jgi:hypothetical protein